MSVHDITRIRGLLVGHAQDEAALTGCTVVLTPGGAVAGVDVRGSAPGTRETDLMRPCNQVERIQGVVLAGGSAYGLDAASGVMKFLEEEGVGFSTPFGIVPIVGAAVIFDLGIGDPKVRPDAAMGYAACRAAYSGPKGEGNIGAGAGATVGKIGGQEYAMKGGLGTYVAELQVDPGGEAEPVLVGALVVVNSLGDVINPWSGQIVAGAYDRSSKTFIGPGASRNHVNTVQVPDRLGTNTTVAVVATDAVLDKEGANKVAQMAQNGLARAIVPAHTMYDGDTVFCLSTAEKCLSGDRAADITTIGSVAAQALAAAVVRAVRAASSVPGCLAVNDI
ncbi:MAG TPA: P1 family peptidase [Bacillota bacterium]|nr:P1 family peptidase [Bacillota bacterium]HOL51793.1 P1 family peptidase [Bacillota bacterium]HPQ03550.1 P1 family peptidase [Bacillota bacterium]